MHWGRISPVVCHKGTLLLAAGLLVGSQAVGQVAPDWRKVGSPAVDLGLAGPVTGPVARVWFSADGGVLFARTQAGRVFETADFESWTPASGSVEPPAPALAAAVRLPEAAARVISVPADPSRIYSLGNQLWGSGDGGHSWTNLTAYKSQSVVGGGMRSLAVSPANPDQLVIGNDFGVWRSLDGGLTWTGGNQALPNLPVRRILATPNSTGGTLALVDGLGLVGLPPGGEVWQPLTAATRDSDAALRERYSAILGARITAVGSAGIAFYAGSSDGRLWASPDGGQTFPGLPWRGGGGPVERIYVDAAAPRLALAALSGTGPHVLRTTNSGGFWDALDYDLPAAPAHSVTADRAAGAIYLATDQGVFYGHADLENASADPVEWRNLTARLPSAPATDVRLDPAGVQLYIALDGYGLYATAAPHRSRSLQIVNAADYSTRPAAPGSLLSVVGGRVDQVRGAGLDYPVLAASDEESQIQVPFEAAGPNVALALATAAGNVTWGLAVQPVSPAILLARDGAPALFDADSGLPVDARNTAHSNGRIQVMATGLGKVRPAWPTGLAAPLENPPVVEAAVKAFLDGAPLQVTRATLAPGYVGFYLIELQLPAIANAGSSALYLSVDGQESNRVRIVIEP